MQLRVRQGGAASEVVVERLSGAQMAFMFTANNHPFHPQPGSANPTINSCHCVPGRVVKRRVDVRRSKVVCSPSYPATSIQSRHIIAQWETSDMPGVLGRGRVHSTGRIASPQLLQKGARRCKTLSALFALFIRSTRHGRPSGDQSIWVVYPFGVAVPSCITLISCPKEVMVDPAVASKLSDTKAAGEVKYAATPVWFRGRGWEHDRG